MSEYKGLNKLATVTYEKYPQKPTIVFLHDSLGCIETWRDFPRQLGERTGCNVLIYDRQGYGKSGAFHKKRENDYLECEANILNSLLDLYKIDQAILFGHSDGGSIALIAAAKFPLKIQGIITEGAHVFVEEVTLRGIENAIHTYETSDLKPKLEKYHGNKTENMFWAWAGTWTSESFRSWNILNYLERVLCPSLIIQGEQDEYGTIMQVETIMQQTRGESTQLIIPDVKHVPHREVPDIVLDESSKFISHLLLLD